MASIRTSIILDEKIMTQVRVLQAKLIRDTGRSVSFSKVINMLVKDGLYKK